MKIHEMAGKKTPKEMLIDSNLHISAYYENKPDISNDEELVKFGTSGHRGISIKRTFTEQHILAITQAICDYRNMNSISGPIFVGRDTHLLSSLAEKTALEVLNGNGVMVFYSPDHFTPTPVISHAILSFNKGKTHGLADGIVITPSHNGPDFGGFKYNPPHGGPAENSVTKWIEKRANEIIKENIVKRKREAKNIIKHDFLTPYVRDLINIIDIDAIKKADLIIGVDPLGGSTLRVWELIKDFYKLNIEIVNNNIDPTFSFMTLDHDGTIRMDCSSQYAMRRLIELKNKYQVAIGNDPDGDRHGIVTSDAGLMNSNHVLVSCVDYLLEHRNFKSRSVAKTFVTSLLIDKVVKSHHGVTIELPVGFKYFARGLLNGEFIFGGEESAGASFLRKDGSVWSTDKDGIIVGLLACEIEAKTKESISKRYEKLTNKFGKSYYMRIDVPTTPAEKKVLEKLNPDDISLLEICGDKVLDKFSVIKSINAPIGGIKVSTENGWFAIRPSGTENVYKIYAESIISENHLDIILKTANNEVLRLLNKL